MKHGKYGIARLQGFERFKADGRWSLEKLVAELSQAIMEVESDEIEWPMSYLNKFRLARDELAELAAADGAIDEVLGRMATSTPTLAEWEIYSDVLGLPRLEGLSFGHPILSGYARPIHTSLLLYIDTDKGYARTLSRYYLLGRKRGDKTNA